MLLYRRRKGSNRSMDPIELEMCSDSSDEAVLTFEGEDGIYYTIQLESAEEGREFLSLAHIAYGRTE